MKKIKIDAHAKINLSLDVIRRKSNGYHELSMIMQQIDLKDIITIETVSSKEKNIQINSDNLNIPLDENNIVYKAWKEISKKYDGEDSVTINIEKNIPVSAGLAGGSTDAAAVLKGLNKLWNLNLTQEQLCDIGLKIGADVPFCIVGSTALSEGIGEKLTKLKPFSQKHILLANPGIEVSTKDVYQGLNLEKIQKRPNIKQIIKYIEQDDTHSLAKDMVNVLETVTIDKHPQIDKIKKDMMANGAIGSLMSGSGATVFGIFNDRETLNKCKEELEKQVKIVIDTSTI